VREIPRSFSRNGEPSTRFAFYEIRTCRRNASFHTPHMPKNAALCGLRLGGSCALLVQGPITGSVGAGSEKSVSDARTVNASAASSLFMSRSALPSSFGPSPRGAASPHGHKTEERRSMSSEQNKAIVRRLLEEPWKGDLRVVDELVDREYVGYDPSIPEPLRGPDGFKENISTYRAAYSDARITVDDQIAEGDKVATRWTGRGLHDGDLMGVAPTGKQVKVSGLTLSRLENGKVIEEYTNWDTFGMMQQLGVVPELAHA
jgi:predicted ester cyclase